MTTPTSSIASGSDNPAFSLEGDSLTITTTTSTTTSISPIQRIITQSSTSGSGGIPATSGGGGLSLEDVKKLLDLAKQSSQAQQPSSGTRGTSDSSMGGITSSGTLGGTHDLSSLLGALGNKDTKDQLSAVLSTLNGKENSTLAAAVNSMSDLGKAISNLLSATNLQETSEAATSTTLSLAQLIYLAATSETARKSGQFCHRECGPSCIGNCGCPGCGCSKGECGCGWFGRCFCNWWGLICGVDRTSQTLQTELERLEKVYGKSVLLIALSHLNMDVVGILAGSAAVSLPPIEEIEEACRKASTNFVNILRQQTADMWCAAAARFSSITEDNFWKGCIVKALAYPTEKMNEELLENKVCVISTGAGGKFCSNYNISCMAESMYGLKIVCQEKVKSLGILQIAEMIELVSKVLWIATDEGNRPTWISTEKLMSLVAVVLARSNLSFASRDGTAEESKIFDKIMVKELFEADMRGKDRQGEKQTFQISQKFVHLAENCFGKALQKQEILQDSRNVRERDALILSMSNRWLLAAGIRSPQTIIQQPSAINASTEVLEEGLTAQDNENVEIII
ncbi:hypothetical protein [Chlamydia pecorum]|uniref:hypothetical protein n=1 Tax=Chlamydia pecorum TaxID=85991 RepID=UPI0007B229FA|nr:hypothetical protein [Chlamydia pecorum]KZN26901.1 hypothetical protein cpL71_0758 [Chlamydia pecorum]